MQEWLEVAVLLQVPMYISKGLAALETRRHEREFPNYQAYSPNAARDREYTHRFLNCMWLPTPFDVIAAGRIAYDVHREEAAHTAARRVF